MIHRVLLASASALRELTASIVDQRRDHICGQHTVGSPVIVALANPPHGRLFLVEFSVALGFVGLAMMGLQFALVAHFKTVAARSGSTL